MIRLVHLSFVVSALVGFVVSELQAKVWLLPDYQQKQLYSHRVNTDEPGSNNKPSEITCRTYGYYSAAERPENSECTQVTSPIPGLACYSCTACPSAYSYDSSNCSGEYAVSGESCGGKYNKCICNPAQYPGSSSGTGCAVGEKVDLGQSCTNKSDGETFYKCVDDPCYDLIDDNTCRSGGDYCYASSSCPGKCESCDANTCGWPENVGYSECEEGCDTNGSIEGCPSRCKTGCNNPCSDLIAESSCSSSGKYCKVSTSCSGKCESCDTDTCSWPENLGYPKCTEGCDSNGSIEGCSSRCKTGCKQITCSRGQKLEDGVCVDMSCSERLAADGYAVVTNYGEFYEAMKEAKPAVIMNNINIWDVNENGDYYIDIYPGAATITNSLYTPAYFKQKDSFYSSCPTTTPSITIDYNSSYLNGAKEIYPDMTTMDLSVYNDVSFYGRSNDLIAQSDITINTYGKTYNNGYNNQGTLNLYGPYIGSFATRNTLVANVYDDLEGTDTYGEIQINLHNPGKKASLGIVDKTELNLDSGVILNKSGTIMDGNSTMNMAAGACIEEASYNYRACAVTPVEVQGQREIVPISCSEKGITETDYKENDPSWGDISYSITCKGTISNNCPAGTEPVRLHMQSEDDEMVYAFPQDDGSFIYCPYMYTPKKLNASSGYSLITEGDCYSLKNNTTGELVNMYFKEGVICAKEKITCEKQIMTKYPQAMIIKSEADLDEMMTEEKLSELSTNDQPAVLVNDITLSKSQTWKGYGSVKFVGATYFSDISECSSMEMPTVNLNGNSIKVGSELNMFNLHISGNSPSTDAIIQIGSFDISFQNGKMSDLSLEAESCYDLYWDGGRNNWLKNVEMSNVILHKVDATVLWDDGDDGWDYWNHEETMNETVSSGTICEYKENSVSYPSWNPNDIKACGWDSGSRSYVYYGTCTCNGVGKETSGSGADCWDAYVNFAESCRWSCV